MSLKINDNAPDFSAETTQGKINFYDWAGDSWVVLFSHPKNFTPVCTTELGALESIKNEFDKFKKFMHVFAKFTIICSCWNFICF